MICLRDCITERIHCSMLVVHHECWSLFWWWYKSPDVALGMFHWKKVFTLRIKCIGINRNSNGLLHWTWCSGDGRNPFRCHKFWLFEAKFSWIFNASSLFYSFATFSKHNISRTLKEAIKSPKAMDISVQVIPVA